MVIVVAGQSQGIDGRRVVFHGLGHVFFFEAEGVIGALGHVGSFLQVGGVQAVRFDHARGEGAAFFLTHIHQHREFSRPLQAAAGQYPVFHPLRFQGFCQVDEVLGGAGQYLAEVFGLAVDFLKRAKRAVGAHHGNLEVGACLLLRHVFGYRRSQYMAGTAGSIQADITGHGCVGCRGQALVTQLGALRNTP